jgi:hypothetical protein
MIVQNGVVAAVVSGTATTAAAAPIVDDHFNSPFRERNDWMETPREFLGTTRDIVAIVVVAR